MSSTHGRVVQTVLHQLLLCLLLGVVGVLIAFPPRDPKDSDFRSEAPAHARLCKACQSPYRFARY
jgi:hypothetical protein